MSVLSLPDAKTHLRMKDADNDTGLQAVIDQAESRVAQQIGSSLTVGSSTTARVTGGPQLVLPVAPLGTVTSITSADGQVVDLTTVSYNQASGLVYFTDGWSTFCSTAYDVVFTSGWATIPAGLLWGIKECVREMWLTQRGSNRAAGPEGPAGKTGWEMAVEPYRFVRVGAA